VRVVVDTNVLVSGLISSTGPPSKIVDALRDGRIVAVMSDATFAELDAVLRRPSLHRYFIRSRLTPIKFLDELRAQADLVTPVASAIPIRDERDRPFLELMATHPPPAYFITGDKDFETHQYGGVPVVSAAVFVTLLKQP
jgi:hypothetical protein